MKATSAWQKAFKQNMSFYDSCCECMSALFVREKYPGLQILGRQWQNSDFYDRI